MSEKAISLNDLETDLQILEQTNPVFNTAKMTLFQLAESGDQDAATIADKLGLTREQTQNSANTVASTEQMIISEIIMETRFRTMSLLSEQAKCDVNIDLPCGYTPRAIQFARKELTFIGMDLPAPISEMKQVIPSLLTEKEQTYVQFHGVDATNFASMKEALKGIEGTICITTEGLMMYFTESEVEAFCENISKLLKEHGGCWITADPEVAMNYILSTRSIVGDRFMELLQKQKKQTSDKADVNVGNNSMVIKPKKGEAGFMEAMKLLAKFGLQAERMIIADHMPELRSLSKVSPEQAAAYKASMKQCAFWKITLSDAGKALDTADVMSKNFDASAELREGTLFLHLTGRLDTITAPNLLAFYQKNSDRISGVYVDCSDLEYISSAGLRVLLMMQKGTENGVTVSGINDVVREILEQTGFDQLLNVK